MAGSSEGRTRTASWEDPTVTAEAAGRMAGLDFLRAIARGELPRPPIGIVLGFGLIEVEEGRAAFSVQPAEHHYNPIGVVHGGLLATVLDSAMGCAVHSTLGVGEGYTTLELKVNYVRAVTRDTGLLRCTAQVLYRGGRIATAEGRAVDERGRLYAHGTTTCLLIRP
jgi:uncharacterized protein (TIGR00369 family)